MKDGYISGYILLVICHTVIEFKTIHTWYEKSWVDWFIFLNMVDILEEQKFYYKIVCAWAFLEIL